MVLFGDRFLFSDKPPFADAWGPGELPGPLASSDSLRNGVRNAVADLAGLALGPSDCWLRPPVTFYVGGRVPV